MEISSQLYDIKTDSSQEQAVITAITLCVLDIADLCYSDDSQCCRFMIQYLECANWILARTQAVWQTQKVSKRARFGWGVSSMYNMIHNTAITGCNSCGVCWWCWVLWMYCIHSRLPTAESVGIQGVTRLARKVVWKIQERFLLWKTQVLVVDSSRKKQFEPTFMLNTYDGKWYGEWNDVKLFVGTWSDVIYAAVLYNITWCFT